jgi:hypothetical protein
MKTVEPPTTSQQARRLSPAALRAFFKLAELWGLNIAQQITLLGSPKRSTFFEWKKNPERELGRDTLERLSYMMGIYKALQILFTDTSIADRWVTQKADIPPFGGRTPLTYMLRGDMASLHDVRRYLDAQRGAW